MKNEYFHNPGMSTKSNHLINLGWKDYELLDSGDRKKLERFGPHQLIRFEPDAVWKPSLPNSAWEKADAKYTLERGKNIGSWTFLTKFDHEWTIEVDGLNPQLSISASRHIGIFPEQIENWRWISEQVANCNKDLNILNLFGYTGIASFFAARNGANVTHVDASRRSVEMAKKTSSLSNLSHLKIRWIVDDAFKFVKKEIRRGRSYDAIIMDPPQFGRGPGGEIWKFDENLPDLLNQCLTLFTEEPLFFIITAYNTKNSPESIAKALGNLLHRFSGRIEYGKLMQKEKSSGRKIDQAIYSRWTSNN